MTSRETLKKVAISRIDGARLLLNGGDWEGASHMMALALECALKAAICKTLRVENYPEKYPSDKKVPDFFMTHSFDRLLLLSGLLDIFSASGNDQEWNNWSSFTIQFPGEWTAMRYDPAAAPNIFGEILTRQLMNSLYDDEKSVIKAISTRERW